jgi:3-deoxy-D-manno-octulosonic-acid transferase
MSLSRLAKQTEHHPGFIAAHLATYQQEHHMDDQALAEMLGATDAQLTHLKLCQLPRHDHRQQDIQCIAEHLHIDTAVLTQLFNIGEV